MQHVLHSTFRGTVDTIPSCGNGLPLGMQIAAPTGADEALLGIAAWCEVQLPFAGLA